MAQLQSLSINGTDIIDLIYPVGCFFLTTDPSSDPNELFSGTAWETIEERFLYGVGGQHNTPEETGGSDLTTLTVDQLPTNIGTISTLSWVSDNAATGAFTKTRSLADQAPGGTGALFGTNDYTLSGAGQSINNMPPYYTTYIWHRTA